MIISGRSELSVCKIMTNDLTYFLFLCVFVTVIILKLFHVSILVLITRDFSALSGTCVFCKKYLCLHVIYLRVLLDC